MSPTREALDYETNSPQQHLRECIGNSMEICILMLRWKWSKRTNYDLHNPRTTAESMKSSLAFSNELNCSL